MRVSVARDAGRCREWLRMPSDGWPALMGDVDAWGRNGGNVGWKSLKIFQIALIWNILSYICGEFQLNRI